MTSARAKHGSPGSSSGTAIERDELSPDDLESALRSLDPPVIARIEADRVVLDLRTVLEEQNEQLATLLGSVAV